MKRFTMMKLTLMLILYGWGIQTEAQGINFFHGDMDSAMEVAKKENKIIFIDFYTSWCAPCKIMAAKVFPLPEVSGYFNEHFISCKLDAEKEGRAFAAKYEVSSYPTYLFLTPDGMEIQKSSGAKPAEDFLADAKQAVLNVNDPENLGNLKRKFASSNTHDEQFLEYYIGKLKENKENPIEAVDMYLKVQKSMKESSSKMMEFLLKNNESFVFGGEGERIFNENYEHYMDMATTMESRRLAGFRKTMMFKLTRRIAKRDKDAKLYEIYLDRWVKYPDDRPKTETYNILYLDYLVVKNDRPAFHQKGMAYVDSIIASMPEADIKIKDKERYEVAQKKYSNAKDTATARALIEANRDVIARQHCYAILLVGAPLVKDADASELKKIHEWIGYGKELMPENFQLLILESQVYAKEGKKKKADASMEKANQLSGTMKLSKKEAQLDLSEDEES